MLGVSWGLLGLWAYLFKIVGIDIVHKLITEQAFIYVFSCMIVAIGIAVARDNVRMTAAIRTIRGRTCRTGSRSSRRTISRSPLP